MTEVEKFVEAKWGIENVRKMSRDERLEILRFLKYIDINPEVEITDNDDGTRTYTIVDDMNGDIFDFVMGL